VILIIGIVGITIPTVAFRNNSFKKTVVFPALIIAGTFFAFFIYYGWALSISPCKVVEQFVNKKQLSRV
jgi:hypothetical protein